MKVIVTGSRYTSDRELVNGVLLHFIENVGPITEIVYRFNVGVDLLAKTWAEDLGIPQRRFTPDWRDLNVKNARILIDSTGVKYNGNAELTRDELMIKRADVLVLIWKANLPPLMSQIRHIANTNGLPIYQYVYPE